MSGDPYAYWRAALGDPLVLAPTTKPQAGFWRTNDKERLPIAIWPDAETGEMECLVDGEDSHANLAWLLCRSPMLNPITEEVYDALLAGKVEKVENKDPLPTSQKNQPDLDGFDALQHELEAEIETAEELLKAPVKDQEVADRVGVWAKKLSEIEARAEQRRVVDKEPFLVGGREVDARWKPVTVRASTFASRLKQHLQAFLQAKQAAERQRAEAERQKAAEAWVKTQTIVDEEERARVVAEAQAAEEAAIAKKASAGRTGMKVGLRSEKRARIIDYDKCLAAVAQHPDVKAVVETLAQRSVRGGNPLPGVEVVTVEKVV